MKALGLIGKIFMGLLSMVPLLGIVFIVASAIEDPEHWLTSLTEEQQAGFVVIHSLVTCSITAALVHYLG